MVRGGVPRFERPRMKRRSAARRRSRVRGRIVKPRVFCVLWSRPDFAGILGDDCDRPGLQLYCGNSICDRGCKIPAPLHPHPSQEKCATISRSRFVCFLTGTGNDLVPLDIIHYHHDSRCPDQPENCSHAQCAASGTNNSLSAWSKKETAQSFSIESLHRLAPLQTNSVHYAFPFHIAFHNSPPPS